MTLLALVTLWVGSSSAPSAGGIDYRVLATNKTSTMERELNDAARDGFVPVRVMGGETEHGGKELVVIVERDDSFDELPAFEYRVLATHRTKTMQKELDDAARLGFVFVAQTVFTTAFGGDEVVIVMERSPHDDAPVCEYALLATQRTGTMENELNELAPLGFVARGLSVSQTAFGGKEVVVTTERCVRR